LSASERSVFHHDSINSPTDVGGAEWALVALYLTFMAEDAPQREHSLREVFNGLRWILHVASSWPMMPRDLPPWMGRLSANITMAQSKEF
jgi:transposase